MRPCAHDPPRRRPFGARTRLLLLLVLIPGVAAAWSLDLAATVRVGGEVARVADLTPTDVPAAAGAVVVASGGRPGAAVTISARSVLRRLSLAGEADGLILRGASRCRILFTGQAVARDTLLGAIRAALAPGLPAAPEAAPPSWLAVEVPEITAHVRGDWRVTWPEPRTLRPGRNLVTLALHDGPRIRRLSVVAEAHIYARTAMPTAPVARDQDVAADRVRWVWTDLAGAPGEPITDPQTLGTMVAVRPLEPGHTITRDDLAPRPLVRRGQPVDLVVRRGRVQATVRAECRQDGVLGQTVSVRNQINGSLVVARVTGPGQVTLGR